MKSLGAVQHPLDQCVFMFYSKSGPKNLLGVIGVYVDDFLFVESEYAEWHATMQNIKNLYSWAKHEYSHFVLCGVQHQQHHDWSVSMNQKEYVETSSPGDLFPDHEIKAMKDNDVATSPHCSGCAQKLVQTWLLTLPLAQELLELESWRVRL